VSISDEVFKFYVSVRGMGIEEILEKYGLGGTVLIVVLTYVLYIVNLWLGFSHVVDKWVVLLLGFYIIVGVWDLVGMYFAGYALREWLIGNIWAGFAGIAVALLVIIVFKLKEIRDMCG